MRTVQRQVKSTFFVLIGGRHSELGRILRELRIHVRVQNDFARLVHCRSTLY